jgi:hypothetical protein
MLIYGRRYGRLANRLWACAYLISHAHEHGYLFVNPAFSDYADLFESTSKDPLCRYPAKRSPVSSGMLQQGLYHMIRLNVSALQKLGARRGPFYTIVDIYESNDKTGIIYDLDSDEFMGLLRSRSVLVMNGWLFRTKHLHTHGDVVRQYFTPRGPYLKNVKRTVSEARTNCDLLIGVHMRGGDYRTWHNGRFFYEASQYADFMRQAAALHPNKKVGFLVCSDEPRTLDEFPDLQVTLSQGNMVEDLYSLAGCDLLISSYSTFSQWSSFQGEVPLVMVHEIEGPIRESDFKVARDCALGPY